VRLFGRTFFSGLLRSEDSQQHLQHSRSRAEVSLRQRFRGGRRRGSKLRGSSAEGRFGGRRGQRGSWMPRRCRSAAWVGVEVGDCSGLQKPLSRSLRMARGRHSRRFARLGSCDRSRRDLQGWGEREHGRC